MKDFVNSSCPPSVLDQFEMIRQRYLDTINAPAQT